MNLASIVWDVDPVLVRIGSIELRWYGLMWGLGFILAYEIMARLFKKEGHPDTWVDKLFVYCIVSSVIGARLGHSSHGGVFLLILALVWYSKKVTKKSVWWLFDRMIPAVAVVCMCIRFGNLMNSEIFGYPTTLPWGFEFVRSREWQELYNQDGAAQACHPTQIYEMLYCFVALIVSWVMYHKYQLQKYVGLITGVSLLIFFGSRFGLEFMKNPQVAEEVGMTLNIGQLLSIPLILLGIFLIATCKKRKADWK